MDDTRDKTALRQENKTLRTEKEFKDKLVAEGVASPDEVSKEIHGLAWAEIVRTLFDGSRVESGDPLEKAVQAAFVEWANRERLDDLDDLLIVKADGSPLTGSVAEVRLKARKLVQDTDFQRKALAGVLLYTLAPTLRRWETLQMATPENIGDVLLPAFGGGDAPRPQPTRSLADFGVRLWRLLQTQEDRDIEYWKTVRAFGDFFVRAKGQETLALAATAYHVLIQTQTKNAEDVDAADLILGAANNLASLLDDLASKAQPSQLVASIAAAGRLHVMVADSMSDRWRMPKAEFRARALDDLGNTPSTFQQDGEDSLRRRYLRQAWFSARTGVVRARLRTPGDDDAKDVASAFFNAGVAILRTGSRRSAPVVTARIVLNVLGLWWALHLSSGDEIKGLEAYNGGDCAVNLMGALTDLDKGMIGRLRDGSLPQLWAGLHAMRGEIGGADSQRIAKSAEEMELEKSPSREDEPLMVAVTRFLAQTADLLELPWLSQVATAGGRQHAAYQSWWAIATALCPLARPDGGVAALCRPVWRVLNRVPPHLDELPEAIAGDWLAFLDKQHPLVVAGLMKAEEMDALLARGKGAESLGEWMEKNAWNLAGALAR